MTRPSRNTDKLLIEAGKREIEARGFSGLTLRQVAKRAGVNLGMFHYHFKNKEEFTRLVAQALYDDFFKDLTIQLSSSGSPLDQLRASLVYIGKYTRERSLTLLSLLRDVNLGNQEAVRFVMRNIPRHIVVLLKLVRRCQKQGYLKPLPLATATIMMVASVVAPNMASSLVAGLLKNAGPAGLLAGPLKKIPDMLLNSDKDIALRVDLAIKAQRKGDRGGK